MVKIFALTLSVPCFYELSINCSPFSSNSVTNITKFPCNFKQFSHVSVSWLKESSTSNSSSYFKLPLVTLHINPTSSAKCIRKLPPFFLNALLSSLHHFFLFLFFLVLFKFLVLFCKHSSVLVINAK